MEDHWWWDKRNYSNERTPLCGGRRRNSNNKKEERVEGVAIKKEKYCGEKKQKRDFRVTAGILILKKERGISSEKKIILKAAIVKVSSEFDEK